MFRYHIKGLNTIDHVLLEELDSLVRVVFPNSMTISQIKQEYMSVPFSVFFLKKHGEVVFCSLIFPSNPTLYIYYICVPKKHRGSGVFKKALRYLKAIYSRKGYTAFALDASEESDTHMNQRKRLQIFNSMGFRLSKLKNPSPFTEHADPKTYIVTHYGKGLLIDQQGEQYVMLLNGIKKTVLLKEIQGCVSDMESDNPDLCPMVMKITPGRRFTKKNGPGGD